MKKPLSSGGLGFVATRRLGIGMSCLLLVAAFAALAREPAFSKVAMSVKRAHPVVAWCLRADQWRSDLNSLVTQAEFLLCPESGAGARINLETDE